MIACRNFLNRQFPDTTQQPIDGAELEAILLNPQQVQNWLTKKYENYLQEQRVAQEAAMRQATFQQEDSNPSEEQYNGGGLMKMLRMDIDTDEPPSIYMVTAKEFSEKMASEGPSSDRIEDTMLNQLLEDLFPKVCAIFPAGDVLPAVRFIPAQLKRDILMASILREPMVSFRELCEIWDEWTFTQLPRTSHAVTKTVPSPCPEPLQSPTFSRKRIKFTIASHNEHKKSTKKPKINQISTVVSSITSVPSTTTTKGQKLRSTMRKETPQAGSLPPETRPVPFTSPTRSSNWSWGEPRTDGSSDSDRRHFAGGLPTPIDQHRVQHEARVEGSNNHFYAPPLQQMPIMINKPVGNVHPGGNGAWNIHHHEATTGFQQNRYPFGSYMPPPWNAGDSPFGPMIGKTETQGMGGFAENLQLAHSNFPSHQSNSKVRMPQMRPVQLPGRYESNARLGGPRGTLGGQRSQGGRDQRRGRPPSRQHHNASTHSESMNATSVDRSLHNHFSPPTTSHEIGTARFRDSSEYQQAPRDCMRRK
jgi:hypothetical protein